MATRFTRCLAVSLFLAGSLVPASASAQVADHLECYKIKDGAGKAAYTADLDGLAVETGCTIHVPAKLLCVDTTKENLSPGAVNGGEGPVAGRFLCYKVKCPKLAYGPVGFRDQFGERDVEPKTSKLVCAPELPTDLDDDGVADASDLCPEGDTDWTSTGATDHDSDGCRDAGTEDPDDDNDGLDDASDLCPTGDSGWTSSVSTDNDGDGCRDASSEDGDDDNDGLDDESDSCPLDATNTCSPCP